MWYQTIWQERKKEFGQKRIERETTGRDEREIITLTEAKGYYSQFKKRVHTQSQPVLLP